MPFLRPLRSFCAGWDGSLLLDSEGALWGGGSNRGQCLSEELSGLVRPGGTGWVTLRCGRLTAHAAGGGPAGWAVFFMGRGGGGREEAAWLRREAAWLQSLTASYRFYCLILTVHVSQSPFDGITESNGLSLFWEENWFESSDGERRVCSEGCFHKCWSLPMTCLVTGCNAPLHQDLWIRIMFKICVLGIPSECLS